MLFFNKEGLKTLPEFNHEKSVSPINRENVARSPVIEQKRLAKRKTKKNTKTQVKKWNDVNKNNEINKLKIVSRERSREK